jgi:hypothetical protein
MQVEAAELDTEVASVALEVVEMDGDIQVRHKQQQLVQLILVAVVVEMDSPEDRRVWQAVPAL